MKKNVIVLALAQVLSMSGTAMLVFLGGLIGADLAPSPTWATLPVSLLVVGVAAFTLPAAFLMRRFGRKRGFILSAVIASLASLLGAYAVAQSSFFLFCLAAFLAGANSAFTQQYRFAAVESVEASLAPRAVSLVMVGGILAGFIGPEIARRAGDVLPLAPYVSAFVALAVINLALGLWLTLMDDVRVAAGGATEPERPLAEIVAQPAYRGAVLSGVVAYGVMSFIMTATPLYLHNHAGYNLDQTAWVIQSHIMAMFLPSLFTGFLIERLGVLRVMVAGVAAMFACVLLSMVSRDLAHFWGALVLLGVGWNFLFVGGTLLLTNSYRPSERFKAQALNDFTIFVVQALGSLLAGTVLFHTNWQTLNLVNLPLLLLTLWVIFLLSRRLTPVAQKA